MEENDLVLCRNFSALGQFQSEHQLWYMLESSVEEEGPCVIALRSVFGHAEHGTKARVNVSRQQARQFLLFLYENAVEPENLSALVADFGLKSSAGRKDGAGA